MTLTDHFLHAVGVLSHSVFAGAGASAAAVIVLTIRPRWERIKYLCAGNIEPEVAAPPVLTVRYRSHDAAAAQHAQVAQ
ncbi:hypothetical protein SFC76_03140 [Sphingomonas sp. CD22]|uniref:hypothetical protein n=1 Tax=Sphingomonas sp. CD22 TaxID=3100214 RepID=UPI002ADF6307|nr:hypothetical protein [Sphingomonas sp. CD22]MEA1083244.1 hypothetical protein [Sphingomonas sp. CD22]